MRREPAGNAPVRRVRPPAPWPGSAGRERAATPAAQSAMSVEAIRKELHRVADAAGRPAALHCLADPDLRLILATLTELLQGQREFENKYGDDLRAQFKTLAYAIRDAGSVAAAPKRESRK